MAYHDPLRHNSFFLFSFLICCCRTSKSCGYEKADRASSATDMARGSASATVWEIQAGLLTPLNFARHRLSPLADFTSGAPFLHNGMANFTLPTLKAFFEARSHNVFSRVDFLCWLLFRYPFHPRVTRTVARKKSRSFCQKCRWQVTAKHAYTLRMWILLNRASALVTTCP